MNRISYLVAATLAIAAGISSIPARAQNARSFVSAQSGVDGNPCTRPSPCRTFAYAITKTNAGGEINTLDPGGYGSVAINKSISIVSGLGEAGVLVSSGDAGITISSGASIVNLRGLIIEGASVGATGILVNGTTTDLTIENCVIRNLTADGIDFEPTVASALATLDTFVANTGSNGIYVAPTGSGAVTAAFARVEVHNTQSSGFAIDGSNSTGTLQATITDSVAANNPSGAGFGAYSLSGHAATSLMVTRSVSANNDQGLFAATNATLWVGQSTVTENASGWTNGGGGTMQSYGTNQIAGNGSSQGQLPAVSTGSN